MKTPEHIDAILRWFAFKPEPNQVRADFVQWRTGAGQPLELYADVYKNGLLKLYTRTGLMNFPKGKTPNTLTEHFEGYVENMGELVKLLYQTRMIDKADFNGAVVSLNLKE